MRSSLQDHTRMQNLNDFQPASAPNASRLGQYRERLLRLPDVLFLTGLGKSSIYACIKEGSFPTAVNITEHAVAWRESEVNAWIATRTAAAQPAQPAQATKAATSPQTTKTGQRAAQ